MKGLADVRSCLRSVNFMFGKVRKADLVIYIIYYPAGGN